MPYTPAPSLATAAAGVVLLAAVPQEAATQGTGSSGSSGVGGGVSTGLGTAPSAPGRSGSALSTSPSRPAVPSRPTTTVPGALPPSTSRPLAPRVPPVAPLSPPATSTFLGTGQTTTTLPGGATRTVPSQEGTTATFPSGGGSARAGSTSPSESAPSTPGGGGDSFEACMGFWDAGTHMTKRQWARSCRRVMNRLQNLQTELESRSPESSGRVARQRRR